MFVCSTCLVDQVSQLRRLSGTRDSGPGTGPYPRSNIVPTIWKYSPSKSMQNRREYAKHNHSKRDCKIDKTYPWRISVRPPGHGDASTTLLWRQTHDVNKTHWKKVYLSPTSSSISSSNNQITKKMTIRGVIRANSLFEFPIQSEWVFHVIPALCLVFYWCPHASG